MCVDSRRFDALTKDLATTSGRRDILRRVAGAVALAAGLGAGLTSREADAARICREGGRTCREHANCCSEVCLKADATGRRRCACEAPFITCGTSCCDPTQICENNHCVTPPPPCIAEGNSCDPNNDQCCSGLGCSFTDVPPTNFTCEQPIP
jgi:hypothetical protein